VQAAAWNNHVFIKPRAVLNGHMRFSDCMAESLDRDEIQSIYYFRIMQRCPRVSGEFVEVESICLEGCLEIVENGFVISDMTSQSRYLLGGFSRFRIR